MLLTGGCLFWMTRIFFGVDTPEGPPPQKPLPVPPPKQKGYQSAPFSNKHPSAYSSRPKTEVLQSYGAKLRYGRPWTRDLPGTYNWLAQSHNTSISSDFHWLSHAGTILLVWGKLLLHWLDSPSGLHSSACASDFWTCPQPPPYSNYIKKGANQLGFSWGFRWYI